MEKREIMAVILAVIGICIVIGVVNMFRGKNSQDSSSDSLPAVSDVVLTRKTDYWDYLREQQETTTATQITEMTGDVTGDVTGAVTGDVPDMTDVTGSAAPAESVTTVTTVTTEEETAFVIVAPLR